MSMDAYVARAFKNLPVPSKGSGALSVRFPPKLATSGVAAAFDLLRTLSDQCDFDLSSRREQSSEYRPQALR